MRHPPAEMEQRWPICFGFKAFHIKAVAQEITALMRYKAQNVPKHTQISLQ